MSDCCNSQLREGRREVAREVVKAVFGNWYDHAPYTDLEREIANNPAAGVAMAMDARDARAARKRERAHGHGCDLPWPLDRPEPHPSRPCNGEATYECACLRCERFAPHGGSYRSCAHHRDDADLVRLHRSARVGPPVWGLRSAPPNPAGPGVPPAEGDVPDAVIDFWLSGVAKIESAAERDAYRMSRELRRFRHNDPPLPDYDADPPLQPAATESPAVVALKARLADVELRGRLLSVESTTLRESLDAIREAEAERLGR